mmetsp:Transcript_50117/g.92498  ORF Transcript_50117/g.92498 Transcript_50117/m.92498 type:complete len:301 (-) Transcript_50117:126-1028(-)
MAQSGTADGWTKGATSYDAFSLFTGQFTTASAKILCQELGAEARRPLRVLDVAAGNGASTFALAAELVAGCGPGTVVDITATDFSPTMVEKLNASLAAGACGSEVTSALQSGQVKMVAQVADAQDHRDFQDSSFDAITCSFGLMFPPRPEKVVEEFWRLLKPGGVAVVSCWHYISLGDEIVADLAHAFMQKPKDHAFAPTMRRFGEESFLRRLFRGDMSETQHKLWNDDAMEFRTAGGVGTLTPQNVTAMLNSNPVFASYGKWDEEAAEKYLSSAWAGADGNIVIRGTSSILIARKPANV